jgi:hypothetical protein
MVEQLSISSITVCTSPSSGFLLGLLFNTKDGGDIYYVVLYRTVLALLYRIRKVPGSNFAPMTGYIDREFFRGCLVPLG